MKNVLLFLLAFASCCNVSQAQFQRLDTILLPKPQQVETAFGTATIEVNPLKAYFAKSAQIETKPDKVIVFLQDEEKESKIGLNVAVVSAAKFKAMFAIKKTTGDFIPMSTKSNGDFYFFGTPGKYTLVLSESDPEKGQSFSSVEGEIAGIVVTDPIKPPPPSGDFDKLIEVTKQASGKIGDKETSIALSKAYAQAASEMKSVSDVAACIELARTYRRAVFAAIPREKRHLDWNSFVTAVAVELSPFQNSVESYSFALSAVAQALLE
jgi:hypothetical protein